MEGPSNHREFDAAEVYGDPADGMRPQESVEFQRPEPRPLNPAESKPVTGLPAVIEGGDARTTKARNKRGEGRSSTREPLAKGPRASRGEAVGQVIGWVQEIAIADITTPPSKREINEEAVEGLMASMTKLGLQTPITVYLDEMTGQPILSVGGHRLEAARRLGRMWEISENLHRADLTALERDEQIAEWIELVERRRPKDQVSNEANKPSQVATVSKGGRGKEGGARAAARELGITKDDAHRAKRVAGLSEEAKQIARKTGLDENRSVLLEAAKAEDSVVFLREKSARRDTGKEASAHLAPNRDEECADFLLAEIEADKIPTLISLMESAKIKNVIEIVRRKLQPTPPSDGEERRRVDKNSP